MPGNFSDWSPYTGYVQSGLVDGRYVSGQHLLLAAGPPRLANIGGAAAISGAVKGGGQAANNIVFPLGLVQQVSVSNSGNFNQLFEIGSNRSYFVRGRSVGQIGLQRVWYHGASLLRTLYAYYEDLIPPTVVPAMWANAGSKAMSNPHDVVIPPGYENFYLNLASDLFTQPVGQLLYIRDNNDAIIGAVYAECCVIPNNTFQTDAQSLLMQENVTMQFERLVPVEVSGLALITNNSTGSGSGANTTFPGIVNS